jgi:hypothetical protein
LSAKGASSPTTMAVLSKLVPIIAGNFALQTAFASVFVPMQDERFYDLCGAAGFLAGTGMSLYYPALRDKFWYKLPGATLPPLTSFAPRQLLLTGCLCLWAGRLGTFLAQVCVIQSISQSTHAMSSGPGKQEAIPGLTRSRNSLAGLLNFGSGKPCGYLL